MGNGMNSIKRVLDVATQRNAAHPKCREKTLEHTFYLLCCAE
jgi:hypothetical protein